MRSAFAALVAAVTVAAGVVGAGCVIVTGSTDGYRAQGSGGGDGGGDGAAVSLACVSAADCGDGGDVCCLVINSTFTLATTACQASCSGTYPVQLCKSTQECGKSGICTTQTCNFGSLTVTIPACGSVMGCTP